MEVPGATAGLTTQCPYCQQLLTIPQQSTYTAPSTSSTAPTAATAAGYFSPHAPSQLQMFPATEQILGPREAPDPLAGLGGGGLDQAYIAPYFDKSPTMNMGDQWHQPRRKSIRGLTFGNVFEMTFGALFPYCLVASGLFVLAGGLSFVLILIAGLLAGFTLKTLELEAQALSGQIVVYGLLAVGVITAILLVTAVYCMTCNTALHVVRGRKITAQVLFGTGESYPGMAVLLMGWYGLVLLRKMGVPWVAQSLVEAGQTDTAIVVGLVSAVILYCVQVALTLLLSYVPFALLDGQSFENAIATSMSIFFGNFLTVIAVMICGGLLYLLVSVLTCGIGLVVFVGGMIYLQAAVYHLASK